MQSVWQSPFCRALTLTCALTCVLTLALGITLTLTPASTSYTRYEGPFTGRKELAGCGGGQPAISKLQPLDPAQLSSGSWTAEAGAVFEAAAAGGDLQAADLSGGLGVYDAGAAEGGSSTILTRLPLGAWSLVRLEGPGAVYVEAGAAAEGGRREVARRSYVEGAVKRVALGVEKNSG